MEDMSDTRVVTLRNHEDVMSLRIGKIIDIYDVTEREIVFEFEFNSFHSLLQPFKIKLDKQKIN